jgi:hypothetical protein
MKERKFEMMDYTKIPGDHQQVEPEPVKYKPMTPREEKQFRRCIRQIWRVLRESEREIARRNRKKGGGDGGDNG